MVGQLMVISGSGISTSGSEGTVFSFSHMANDVCYDSNTQKYIFGCTNTSYRNYLRASTANGSFSFGTQIELTDSSDSNESTANTWTTWLVYNPTSNTITAVWDRSGAIKAKDISISGTTLTRGSTYSLSNTTHSGWRYAFCTSTDSARWFGVFPVANDGSSPYKAFSRQGASSSITPDNYAGFSDGSYSNGQTATIQVTGTVVDGLSGLTPGSKYYVGGDGTPSLTDTYYSNVTAGLALTSSTLLLK